MSNLFDTFKVSDSSETKDHGDSTRSPKETPEPKTPVKNPEKSGLTHISPSKHDKVLDVDSLRAFTIPKAKKQKALMQNVQHGSREFSDITSIIQKSFRDRNSEANFKFTKLAMVHSPHSEKYMEKRKEMRSNQYSEKEVKDSYVYYQVRESELKGLCQKSLKVGNSKSAILGIPEMGVYVSKHADLTMPNPFNKNQNGVWIIFKLMKGRAKHMNENHGETALDPTPQFDCHVSKNSSFDLAAVSHKTAFDSSQIYVYEYDDMCDLVDYPRHLCPFAVMHFVYVGDSRRGPGGKSKSASRTSSASSSFQPVIRQSSFPSQPASAVPPLLGSNTKPVSPKQQFASALPSPANSRSVPSQSPILSPSPQSLPSTPSSPATSAVPSPSDGVLQALSVNTSIGRVAFGGVVVWTGQLASAGVQLCSVDLISHSSSLKPARIGPMLNISSRTPMQYIVTNLGPSIRQLSPDKELALGNRYYNYCQLRPAASTAADRFMQMVAYLMKNSSVATVKLDDADVLLLPNSPASLEIGIGNGISTPDMMHCVFMSANSRSAIKRAKKSAPVNVNSPGSAASVPSPVAGSPLTPGTSYTPPANTPSPGAQLAARVKQDAVTNVFGFQNELGSEEIRYRNRSGDIDMRFPQNRPQQPAQSDSPVLFPGSDIFKEPPPPNRDVSDIDYEQGFQKFVPVNSLIYKDGLTKSFAEQVSLQDKKNVEVARHRYGGGQPSPGIQLPSPGVSGGSSGGSNQQSPFSSNQPSPFSSTMSPQPSLSQQPSPLTIQQQQLSPAASQQQQHQGQGPPSLLHKQLSGVGVGDQDMRDPRMRRGLLGQGAPSSLQHQPSIPSRPPSQGLLPTPPRGPLLPPPFGGTLPIPPNVQLDNFMEPSAPMGLLPTPTIPPVGNMGGNLPGHEHGPQGMGGRHNSPQVPLSHHLPPPNFAASSSSAAPSAMSGPQDFGNSMQPQQSVRPPELVQPAYAPATTTYYSAPPNPSQQQHQQQHHQPAQNQNLSKSLSVGTSPTTTSTITSNSSSSNNSSNSSSSMGNFTSSSRMNSSSSSSSQAGTTSITTSGTWPPSGAQTQTSSTQKTSGVTKPRHPTEGLTTTTDNNSNSSSSSCRSPPPPAADAFTSNLTERIEALMGAPPPERSPPSPDPSFSPPSPCSSPELQLEEREEGKKEGGYVPTPISALKTTTSNASEDEDQDEMDEDDLINQIVRNQPLAQRAARLRKEKEMKQKQQAMKHKPAEKAKQTKTSSHSSSSSKEPVTVLSKKPRPQRPSHEHKIHPSLRNPSESEKKAKERHELGSEGSHSDSTPSYFSYVEDPSQDSLSSVQDFLTNNSTKSLGRIPKKRKSTEGDVPASNSPGVGHKSVVPSPPKVAAASYPSFERNIWSATREERGLPPLKPNQPDPVVMHTYTDSSQQHRFLGSSSSAAQVIPGLDSLVEKDDNDEDSVEKEEGSATGQVKLDDVVEDMDFNFEDDQEEKASGKSIPEKGKGDKTSDSFLEGPKIIPVDMDLPLRPSTSEPEDNSNSGTKIIPTDIPMENGDVIPSIMSEVSARRKSITTASSLPQGPKIIPTDMDLESSSKQPIPTVGSASGHRSKKSSVMGHLGAASIPIIPMETDILESETASIEDASKPHSPVKSISRDGSEKCAPGSARKASSVSSNSHRGTPERTRVFVSPLKSTSILDLPSREEEIPHGGNECYRMFLKARCQPYLNCKTLEQAGLDPPEAPLFEEERVVVGEELESLKVTFKNDSCETDAEKPDKEEEMLLTESVQAVLFNCYVDDSDDEPETDEDRVRGQLVALALHYLLPLMEIMADDKPPSADGSKENLPDGAKVNKTFEPETNKTATDQTAAVADRTQKFPLAPKNQNSERHAVKRALGMYEENTIPPKVSKFERAKSIPCTITSSSEYKPELAKSFSNPVSSEPTMKSFQLDTPYLKANDHSSTQRPPSPIVIQPKENSTSISQRGQTSQYPTPQFHANDGNNNEQIPKKMVRTTFGNLPTPVRGSKVEGDNDLKEYFTYPDVDFEDVEEDNNDKSDEDRAKLNERRNSDLPPLLIPNQINNKTDVGQMSVDDPNTRLTTFPDLPIGIPDQMINLQADFTDDVEMTSPVPDFNDSHIDQDYLLENGKFVVIDSITDEEIHTNIKKMDAKESSGKISLEVGIPGIRKLSADEGKGKNSNKTPDQKYTDVVGIEEITKAQRRIQIPRKSKTPDKSTKTFISPIQPPPRRKTTKNVLCETKLFKSSFNVSKAKPYTKFSPLGKKKSLKSTVKKVSSKDAKETSTKSIKELKEKAKSSSSTSKSSKSSAIEAKSAKNDRTGSRSRSRSSSRTRKRSRSKSKVTSRSDLPEKDPAKSSESRSKSSDKKSPERGRSENRRGDRKPKLQDSEKRRLQPIAFKAYEQSQKLHLCRTNETFQQNPAYETFRKSIEEMQSLLARLRSGEIHPSQTQPRFKDYKFKRHTLDSINRDKIFSTKDDLRDQGWKPEEDRWMNRNRDGRPGNHRGVDRSQSWTRGNERSRERRDTYHGPVRREEDSRSSYTNDRS